MSRYTVLEFGNELLFVEIKRRDDQALEGHVINGRYDIVYDDRHEDLTMFYEEFWGINSLKQHSVIKAKLTGEVPYDSDTFHKYLQNNRSESYSGGCTTIFNAYDSIISWAESVLAEQRKEPEEFHIIHVNKQFIAMNAKDGRNRPVYTIKSDGPNSKARYAREVVCTGPSRMVYNGTQLKCGARAWIETNHPIELVDEMDFQTARTFEEELTDV